jgi:2'-5' RNA ligase
VPSLERLRLFVACELPDEARRALAEVQAGLRRAGADRLRWVRPEGIHITLKFLGATEAERLEAIKEALAAAVEPFAIRVRPNALGGFGGSGLRVVWVGLEGDVEALAELAGRVDRALEALGFPREERPFAAHLTLARVPDVASREERRRLRELIEGQKLPALPELTLDRVSLMRSELRPDGSVYTRLASFPGA